MLPRLPVEVVRIRLKRAKELGIDYKSYASIRAASGRDVLAFLFSSNALRVFKATDNLPADRADRLRAVKNCGRLLMVAPPMVPEEVAALLSDDVPFDAAGPAPRFTDTWGETRARVSEILNPQKFPSAGVVMIGDTGFERDCAGAARLGAYLEANRFFAEKSA